MQSANGGWGAFDVDNTYHYLNAHSLRRPRRAARPADRRRHGALRRLPRPARLRPDHPAVRRGVDFIKREQEPDGSWYGRWGVNYVYGTWSALCALNAVGEDLADPAIRKAVAWLEARQRAGRRLGRGLRHLLAGARAARPRRSTPSQTAWALLGLMAAGEVDSEAVRARRRLSRRAPREGARWEEDLWTGVGFPRVFYLKYHGYAAYFPLWALARYRTLMRGNDRRVRVGM